MIFLSMIFLFYFNNIDCDSRKNCNKSLGNFKEKVISRDDNNIISHNEYCRSTYKRVLQKNNSLKLKKLIVIHRHGDRSPLILKGGKWKDIDCITCNRKDDVISDCEISKCKEGDLTLKGYEQMKNLGKFILDNYKELDFSTIKTRCTEISRTQASLHGVMKGLGKKSIIEDVLIPPVEKDSLLVPRNCVYVNNLMEKSVAEFFKDLINEDKCYISSNNFPPQRISDAYLTHFCNDIPVDCTILNCKTDIVKKYIDISFSAWRDQTKNLIQTEKILEIVFGRFANDLKKLLLCKNEVNIISAHDSSLSIILAGLGTDIVEHPPYASAIFLELWQDDNYLINEEDDSFSEKPNLDGLFVRIIYNDEVCQTSIHSDENIPLEKLINYFNILIISENGMIAKCNMKEYIKSHDEELQKFDELNIFDFVDGPKI